MAGLEPGQGAALDKADKDWQVGGRAGGRAPGRPSAWSGAARVASCWPLPLAPFAAVQPQPLPPLPPPQKVNGKFGVVQFLP
jgi:hypothetical protein